MFILPFSLFLVATYLRPRTQAELSYLITAIECLSGIWCLLFAPFSIQISLIGLFLLRNTKEISSLLSGFNSQPSNIDLSAAETPTIDIVAHTVPQTYLPPALEHSNTPYSSHASTPEPAPMTTGIHSLLKSPSAGPLIQSNATSTQIMLYRPHQQTQNHLHTVCKEQQHSILVPTPQLVKMQYRGVTYFKSIPSISVQSYSGQ